MSNLLEQAIIDAAALKEVAIKNAEAALIEKYSREFKESVEKLLEQEQLQPTPEAAPQMSPMTEPVAAPISAVEDDTAEFAADVPSAFLADDDDEVITINFDKIKKQVKDMLGVGGEEEQETAEEEMPEAPVAENQPILEEEFELDEEVLEEKQDDSDIDALSEEDEEESDEEETLDEDLNFTE